MKSPTEDDYFTKEMLENYCATYAESISAISVSESIGSGQIIENELYANVSVEGVSLGYFVANDLTLLDGRYFAEKETSDGNKVAIISDKAVNNMFDGNIEEAIGSTIQINVGDKYHNFTVIGVYEYVQSAMGFSSSSDEDITTSLYIPLKTAQTINHSSDIHNLLL